MWSAILVGYVILHASYRRNETADQAPDVVNMAMPCTCLRQRFVGWTKEREHVDTSGRRRTTSKASRRRPYVGWRAATTTLACKPSVGSGTWRLPVSTRAVSLQHYDPPHDPHTHTLHIAHLIPPLTRWCQWHGFAMWVAHHAQSAELMVFVNVSDTLTKGLDINGPRKLDLHQVSSAEFIWGKQ